MKRFAQQELHKWLRDKRRKPLVIRGARQVGKSTLVRNFAREHQLELVELNLEKHLPLNKTFETLNMGKIMKEIEGLTGKNMKRAGHLLFLDEIQATPHAFHALRYFYEETPDIPVIAAYATQSHLLRLQHVFRQAPKEIGHKIKYSRLAPDERAGNVRQTINLLAQAGVITKIYHAHGTGIPLEAGRDEKTFKILFLDIGLMNRACGLDWLAINGMNERQLINEGALAEQMHRATSSTAGRPSPSARTALLVTRANLRTSGGQLSHGPWRSVGAH